MGLVGGPTKGGLQINSPLYSFYPYVQSRGYIQKGFTWKDPSLLTRGRNQYSTRKLRVYWQKKEVTVLEKIVRPYMIS